MTAIKKNTTKSKSSPTPATTAPSAKSTAARKKSTVKAKVTAPVSIEEATPPTAATQPVVIKPVTATVVETTIAARIDVGFGNALYIRGEGPGLSWDKGVLMTCVSDDTWQITLPEFARPYVFKFLINDATWSTGPDYSVASGTSVTLTPQF